MREAPLADSLAAWDTPLMLRDTSSAPEEAFLTVSERDFVEEVTL